MIESGDVVFTDTSSHRLGRRLGDGGQGSAFVVDGARVAKVYKNLTPDQEAIQWQRLTRMIAAGSPNNAFVWPEQIIVAPALGYIMPLVTESVAFADLCRSDALTRADHRTRLRLCYRLADAFSVLHLKHGYSYCDLSDQNVLCDATTGSIRIIDTDNLVVDGLLPPLVRGTYRHMAPEIQSGAQHRPNVESDLHSLAVLMFELLLFHHPLLGDQVHEDAAREEQALGSAATYIYDPTNSANRYTRYSEFGGVPARVLPAGLRRLFDDAFVTGLHRPNVRVRETRWKQELLAALDTLDDCRNRRCPMRQTFLSEPGERRRRCVWCSAKMPPAPMLAFTRQGDRRPPRLKVIREGTSLAAHHCKVGREFDLERTSQCGTIERSGDLFVLRNTSRELFTYFRPRDTSPSPFPPRSLVRLAPGYRICFGADGYVAEVLP